MQYLRLTVTGNLTNKLFAGNALFMHSGANITHDYISADFGNSAQSFVGVTNGY